MAGGTRRDDYAFPFRIAASGQAARARYPAHVEQMIRQVLLTAPGERVDLPEFGCGLRRLLFAPDSTSGQALLASAQLIVQQALRRWLADQVEVREVTVLGGDDAPEGQVEIEVRYVLIETQDALVTLVRIV